jgi:hypothetical protein
MTGTVIMAFYTGLSLLSNNAGSGISAQSGEGRRVLGLLDGKESLKTTAVESSRRGIELRLETETSGRPCFADRHADFSISHSRRMIAVSFSTGGPRTGCDIQYIHPEKPHAEIASRLFFPEELRYLEAASGTAERSRRFCRLWALKECFLKANGLSVFDMKKCPVFLFYGRHDGKDAGGPAIPEFSAYRLSSGEPFACPSPVFYLYECEGGGGRYALAVARAEEAGNDQVSPPELFWFSAETLPLRRIAEINAATSPEKTVRPNI